MLPTSTNIVIEVKSKLPADAEAVVMFVAEGGRVAGDTQLVLGSAEFENAQLMLKHGVVRGKPREVDFDLLEDKNGKVRRVYLAGLGDPKKLTADIVRQAAGALVRTIRKHRLKRIAVVPPVVNLGREAYGTEVAVEGMLLAAFEWREYRGNAPMTDEEKREWNFRNESARVTILSSTSSQKAITAACDRGRLLADAQNFARTIAFRPGNDVNPPVLSDIARKMCKEVGLSFRALDEKEMKRLGMGGMLGVGGGSIHTRPPRMIVMEWKGAGAGKKSATSGKSLRRATQSGAPLLLVGKAITFDTGGISIKPALNMQAMVFDKCGAMAVLGAMVAIAKLKLPINVVGIMAAAENHISDSAMRPGDILRMYNGVTVEVTNTDAEGRLVLGDALSWGIETYKPAAVVNLATLTGAMVIALGHQHCGIMANDDGIVEEITRASKAAGEKVWRLPLEDAHREAMKSNVADILNSGTRDASSIKAGAFLSFFVPRDTDDEGRAKVPWCHMDIAGVADTDKELPYYGKGATGWGVRTLVHWCELRAGVLSDASIESRKPQRSGAKR